MYKELKECLVCGSASLKVHCDLGMQPLVNNLKDSPTQEEKKYPIVVNECPVCTHKQLSIAVDPKLLFENYVYQTGISESHQDFLFDFARSFGEGNGRSVLDIGSNDGSLLAWFNSQSFKVLGVEPSTKIKTDLDVPTISDFFPTRQPINVTFDIITAFNVFAHNDNPYFFLTEAVKLLKKDGRIYLLTTPARLDNYYHEHISYFTPQSMMVLASRCGLEVKSFKTTTMHGESYLFELVKPKLPEIQRIEGVSDGGIVAYGASASGVVLLNFYDCSIEYVIDDNPLKQGKFIPGVNIPIYAQEHLTNDDRDLNIMILAYHLCDEIVAKVKALRPNKKDVFIHPYKGVL